MSESKKTTEKKKSEGMDFSRIFFGAVGGGIAGGIFSGLCCCFLQIFSGILAVGIARSMKGSKIDTIEGAVTGAVAGVFGGISAAIMNAFVGSFQAYTMFPGMADLAFVAETGLIAGGISFLFQTLAGIVFGLIGGILVAELWK